MQYKTIKGVIQGLSHEGRGITSVNGKMVFVEGALTGETVNFTIEKHHARFDEGRVVTVLDASSLRVASRCPHVAVCAGCSLQHLDSKAQIEFKQQVVLEKLHHFGNVQPQRLLAPLVGESFGYRRKARISLKYIHEKQKIIFGFYQKNHRDIADLKSCDILDVRIAEKWNRIHEILSQLSSSAQILDVEVAMGDTVGALLFRYRMPLSKEDREKLRQFGQNEVLAIYTQLGAKGLLEKLYWPKTDSELTETLNYFLPKNQIRIAFEPLDFIQVNAKVNQAMVESAIELLELEPSDRVLDLFCGLGNFTLPIASLVDRVVGVEGSESSVKRALGNAKLNGLSNVEFYCDNLEKDCANRVWANKFYNKVILDPPRAGAKALLPLLTKMGVMKIVYISCEPSTLARDIGILVHQFGFRLSALRICDMFPHTTHVESIALLELVRQN